MKTALITTTINEPRVLELYRALSPTARFFVTLDRKSVDLKPYILELCARGKGDAETIIFHPEGQVNWSCSELIGWNNIQRRNIALLEAVKWGADIIVSIDDDNLALTPDYFAAFETRLTYPFHGVGVYAAGWVDVGQHLVPRAKHRGIPYDSNYTPYFSSVVDAKIGVAAGACLGNPDVDAVTRMATAPWVGGVDEILRAGFVVDPKAKTVWNSQNTAIVRELAPAWFMLPHCGRMDDIYASLICHRVMREHGYHTHFGPPFIVQERNEHNLVKDLHAEIDGYEKVERLATHLDRLSLSNGASVLAHVRQIWNSFEHTPNSYDLVPKRTVEAALAFCDDMEKVL